MSQQKTDSTAVKVKRLIGLSFEYGGIDIPILGGIVTAITMIAMPIYGIHAHRAAKRELKVLWQRADQLGLNGKDLKHLSGSKNFGSIDWASSRNGGITPPLDLIRKVNAELAQRI